MVGFLLLLLGLGICRAGAQEAGKDAEVAGWIRDLESDSPEKREAASAELLKAGSRARPAVREILASEDAEVQRRAKTLWETLRWLVVPGADEEVMALIEQCRNHQSPKAEAWKAFAGKHGASTIYLLTQLRLSGDEENFQIGMTSVLRDFSRADLVKMLRAAKSERERRALAAAFREVKWNFLDSDASVRVAQAFNLLWMHREAFEIARQTWLGSKFTDLGDPALLEQAVIAMRMGLFENEVWKEAAESVPEMIDSNDQALALAFYVALSRENGSREKVASLVESMGWQGLEKGTNFLVASHLFRQLMEADFRKAAQVLAGDQEEMNRLFLGLYLSGKDDEEAWNRLMEGLKKNPRNWEKQKPLFLPGRWINGETVGRSNYGNGSCR